MKGRESRLVAWAGAAYGRLMHLHPPAFRARYGRAMRQVFEDRCREALTKHGLPRFLMLLAGATRDLGTTAVMGRVTNHRNRPAQLSSHHRPTFGGSMHSLWKDIQFAASGYRRNLGFTTIAVLTLGLGIGANTAIFSVVEAVLLRPLPYQSPDRLTLVWGELTQRAVTDFPFSPPDLRDIRESRSFEGLAGIFTFSTALTHAGGDPEQVQAAFVTDNFTRVVGVEPILGRAFEPQDGAFFDQSTNPDATPPPNAVILGHGFWQRRFGGDPGVLGRPVELGGTSSIVVGIMPPQFRLLMPPAAGASHADVWTALRLDYDGAPRNNVFLTVLGRMLPGVTAAQAESELNGIMDRVALDFPAYVSSGFRVTVVPLHEDLTEDVRPVVYALLGAVMFVLLIACANVANLLLVRATTRSREISIRAALGGSRTRLLRQMLVESGLLAMLGGGVGLLMALVGLDILMALHPGNLPRLEDVRIDGTVLGFTLAATLGAAIVFGTAPALQATRTDLTAPLKGRSSISTAGWYGRLRSGMVIAEVALSLVLLIGTGLMLRSFVALQRVSPGYLHENVLTFQAEIPFGRYPQARQRANLQAQFADRIRALPGIRDAGGVFPLPLAGEIMNGRYGDETALDDESNYRQADYRAVLPGYFRAMQARLLAGRFFTEADNTDSLPLVVIDDILARRMWPDESAVGRRILVRQAGPDPIWVEVIGVVEHQRSQSLARDGRETIYYSDRFFGSFGSLFWTVRTTGDPLAAVPQIQAALMEVDPLIPLAAVRPMGAYVDDARAPTRFAFVLIAVFGLSALLLASVGLYGVLSYVVRQRTGEIGIRMAFGADGRQIMKLVVRQGLLLAGVGVGIGLVAAVALTRVMRGLLVGVSATDPLTYAAIAAFFIAVAAVAAFLPALRATQVDPMIALRTE